MIVHSNDFKINYVFIEHAGNNIKKINVLAPKKLAIGVLKYIVKLVNIPKHNTIIKFRKKADLSFIVVSF